MGCCGSAERTKREWRPSEDRSCTDSPWFSLFTVFCVGMGTICGYTVATGGAARSVFGYDSYGNTCGRRNERIEGVHSSGSDHTDRRFVFFSDPCNIDIVQRKIKSMASCVSSCPTEESKTYQDSKRFAMTNGSESCSYELPAHNYPAQPERFSRCPKSPVHRSKPSPVFNRCTPVDVSCYAKFAEAVVTFVGDSSVSHRLIAGVAASKEIIIGLCVFALASSMILMVIIRYISAVSVWILTSSVVSGSSAGTGVLWWLYIDYRSYGNATSSKESKEEARDSGQASSVYAASATVFTIISSSSMLFMRKRVALTIASFHVAGKVFIHLPSLTSQPFLTFLALLLFWIYWISVSLFSGTTGNPEQNEETGSTEFRSTGSSQYLTWYHAVGSVWISEFISACQQMTVAGAVVTYYFTRDKNRLPSTPISSSVSRSVRYHSGTVAKGSFIITSVKIPRLVLMYVHNQSKGRENVCARCSLKSCICCSWCSEKCLNYSNQNAYAATAINSTSFCTSARDAFVISVENASRVATINAVGDFVLFSGKVSIMTCTAFAGVSLSNYQRDYAEWSSPLIIVCLFSFSVAHCFSSIFEIVVDVSFLCFAIDTKYNDGTPGKEFFMDKASMEFVESSRRSERAGGRGRSRVKEATSEGAEMKPMVSECRAGGGVARQESSPGSGAGPHWAEGGEWEELQEFQVYCSSVGVSVDWVSTEQSDFVLCLSEDVVLFLCVCSPTSTLFSFVSSSHAPSPAPFAESASKSAALTSAC